MSAAQTSESVKGIVIDVCSKTFLLLSDQGDKKFVECENTEQFMNVLKVVTDSLNPDQIVYADVAIHEEDYE
jgi:hypothetical protein